MPSRELCEKREIRRGLDPQGRNRHEPRERHDVTGLSIGMSSDFEAAIMLGATAVRIGTALFEDE